LHESCANRSSLWMGVLTKDSVFWIMSSVFLWHLLGVCSYSFRAGMSNMRPAGRMRPFASTPAARTKDTVIWSFNGQNCSFYNLNWINVRRLQKNSMLFFIQNKNKNISVIIFIKWLQLVVVCGPHDNTNVTHMALGGPSVWHAWFRVQWRCCWVLNFWLRIPHLIYFFTAPLYRDMMTPKQLLCSVISLLPG